MSQRRSNACMPRRSGALMLMLLVALFITMLITTGIVRKIMQIHRETQTHQRILQSMWLAEAGIQRATASLAADEKYVGETWNVTAADLNSKFPAQVSIQVTPVESSAETAIEVVADYPVAERLRCRTRKQITIPSTAVPNR